MTGYLCKIDNNLRTFIIIITNLHIDKEELESIFAENLKRSITCNCGTETGTPSETNF